MATQTAEEIRAQIAALEKELAKAEEAEAKAAQAGNAKRAIALLAAAKAAVSEIERLFPGTFDGEKFPPLTQWPRANKPARAGGLSETEVKNAQQRGVGAVAKL